MNFVRPSIHITILSYLSPCSLFPFLSLLLSSPAACRSFPNFAPSRISILSLSFPSPQIRSPSLSSSVENHLFTMRLLTVAAALAVLSPALAAEPDTCAVAVFSNWRRASDFCKDFTSRSQSAGAIPNYLQNACRRDAAIVSWACSAFFSPRQTATVTSTKTVTTTTAKTTVTKTLPPGGTSTVTTTAPCALSTATVTATTTAPAVITTVTAAAVTTTITATATVTSTTTVTATPPAGTCKQGQWSNISRHRVYSARSQSF